MQSKKNAAKGVAAKILGSGVLTWVLLLAIWKAGSRFLSPGISARSPGDLERSFFSDFRRYTGRGCLGESGTCTEGLGFRRGICCSCGIVRGLLSLGRQNF